MGSDKGLLKLYDSTWTEIAYDKISRLQLPVVISVNQNQYKDYSSLFLSQQLITDDNTLQLKGPLCVLLSVHKRFPEEDLLLPACDIPLLEIEILQELLSQYDKHSSYDAFIYTNDGEPEPLCGIY